MTKGEKLHSKCCVRSFHCRREESVAEKLFPARVIYAETLAIQDVDGVDSVDMRDDQLLRVSSISFVARQPPVS